MLLDAFPWTTGIHESCLAWGQSTTAGDFAHLLLWRPSGGGTTLTSLTPELEKRFLCHALLSVLPDDALPQLCGSLLDYYDAYFGSPLTSTWNNSSPNRVSARTSNKRLKAEFRAPEE